VVVRAVAGGTVASRELGGTVVWRELGDTVVWRELGGSVALRELGGSVALRELGVAGCRRATLGNTADTAWQYCHRLALWHPAAAKLWPGFRPRSCATRSRFAPGAATFAIRTGRARIRASQQWPRKSDRERVRSPERIEVSSRSS